MKFWTTLLALPLAVVSCSDLPEADTRPAAGTIDVSIGSGPKIGIQTQNETRTALGDDGVTVTWAKDDQIALWAVNSRSESVFSNQVFKLYHYNTEYNTARFTGKVPAMAEDTYTYYAVSPAPEEVSGTTAGYRIPAVQNGAFDGACDVMVAEPITGAAALRQGDNSETVNLRFRHQIHVLKIRIPKNSLGEKVTEMTLTFPEPVAGRMSVDITDPYAAPVLTESSNTLTLQFDEPKGQGDTVFAVIAPVRLTEDQQVSITAAGATRQSKAREFDGKEFSAGHTTPIAFNIPTVGPTTLRFLLANTGEGTLGERIDSFTVTAPEGTDLGNGSNAHTFAVDGAGSYEIVLEDFTDKLSGNDLQITYESKNALITRTFTPSQLKVGGINDVAALSVPYLLSENFDTIPTFSDNESTTGINNPDAIWIPELSGWSAARVGGSAGESVRIVGHREGALFVYKNYVARMDSAPLSGIKNGVSLKVKVSFDYGGSTNKGAPKLKYGTSTIAGLINGTNADIENQIKEISTETKGAYDHVNQSIEPFIATCTNASRLAWVAYGSDGGFSGSFFYYVYLDNIKVSIVNE